MTADGDRGTYRLVGQGSPLTVCLSASPLRTAGYLGDLGGLAAQCPLAIPDLRMRRIDALVADVEALREHLGLDRPDLLAHSAGASLAIRYAAAYPQRLRRLVLITPSTRAVGIQPNDQDVATAIERRSDEAWYPAARLALDAREGADQSPVTRLAVAPFLYGRWDTAARQHAAREADEMPTDAAAVYYTDDALDPKRTRTELAAVDADVLIVTGDLDILPTASMARELAALFPHADLVTQTGAGHYPWLDDAAAFATTVARFLRRGSPPRSAQRLRRR
jgi:pimeloyl-ACP methyl ester carboxylesterase